MVCGACYGDLERIYGVGSKQKPMDSLRLQIKVMDLCCMFVI